MKIIITGDFCPINRNASHINKHQFDMMFNGFEKIIAEVDYAVVNLECPITDSKTKINKTGPCLKSNMNALKALKYAKFDLLTLANNHILDYGEMGVIDTLKNAKEFSFDTIGAAKNISEASMPLIKNIKGIKIGFINIAENEFCAATIHTAGAYTVNEIDNHYKIKSLSEECDKVIIIYHGGREHYQLPSPKLRERLRFYVNSGADAIVAHHTHCFSGYEYFNGKPIFYGLGNFIFDYKKKYQKGKWTQGYAVILKIDEKIDFELVPYNQGREENHLISLMDTKEKEKFNEEIKILNNIIVNDELFFNEWEKYIQTQKLFYNSSLIIQNDYLRAVINKKLFPLLPYSKKHKRLLLNLMRCETHREITLKTLENETNYNL